MSYDITFLPKTVGTTADEIEAFLEDYEGADGPPDKVWMKKARALATLLVAMNPEFEEFDEGTSIELDVAEDAKGFAIDVSIFPGEVTISVPYWYDEDADDLFKELWRYTRLIIEKLEMVAYDGQAGTLWQSEKDALASADAYQELATDVQE
jgi:hypothetical protein